MSVFIQVILDKECIAPELAHQLIEACPVNIFAENGVGMHVVPENEDECTLCELCLRIAPPGTVKIKKLYKDETLVSRGEISR